MKNKTVLGLIREEKIRVIGINAKELVQELCMINKTMPNASAALGRTAAIVSLIGALNPNEEQINVTVDGDGPLGKIHVQYYDNGKIKGYVDNPSTPILINDQNKLDVKGVVGTTGTITIIKKNSLKTDSYGTIEIISGEISEDFTYYFAISEQTPSVVSAGVLVDQYGQITSSGAIIIQLLPGALEEDIVFVENSIEKISNVSSKLIENDDIELFLKDIFPDILILSTKEINYSCNCSYEDMLSKINTLSLIDLKDIKEVDSQIETICHWCNTKYLFNEEVIETLILNKEK